MNRFSLLEQDDEAGDERVPTPRSISQTIRIIKEIINCKHSNEEIYAVLKDCNMDPVAACLLLSFDEPEQEEDDSFPVEPGWGWEEDDPIPVGPGWGWEEDDSFPVGPGWGWEEDDSFPVEPDREWVVDDPIPVGPGWGWEEDDSFPVEPDREWIVDDPIPVGPGWGWEEDDSFPVEPDRQREVDDPIPVGPGWGWKEDDSIPSEVGRDSWGQDESVPSEPEQEWEEDDSIPSEVGRDSWGEDESVPSEPEQEWEEDDSIPSEPEWECEEDGSTSSEPDGEWEEDDVYLLHRKDALKVTRSALRHSKAARNAYLKGDHSLAKHHSSKAREEWKAAKRLHAEAAQRILSTMNSENDMWTLDLHGLHSNEAVDALREHMLIIKFQDLISGIVQSPSLKGVKDRNVLSSSQKSTTLEVITGRGKHSRGQATLPGAIRSFLIENGYRFDEARPGVITVLLK